MVDWAHVVKRLVDEDYADRERIVPTDHRDNAMPARASSGGLSCFSIPGLNRVNVSSPDRFDQAPECATRIVRVMNLRES